MFAGNRTTLSQTLLLGTKSNASSKLSVRRFHIIRYDRIARSESTSQGNNAPLTYFEPVHFPMPLFIAMHFGNPINMIEARLYYRDASLCLDVTAISVTEKRIRSRILRSSPITREVPRTANSGGALSAWHRAKRAGRKK